VVLFSVLYKGVLTFEMVDEISKCGIQMKAIVKYFSVLLFVMLLKVVLALESVEKVQVSVTIQMKATKQHFPVVLFIMLCKVVLTFESVDEILKCDQSNESY